MVATTGEHRINMSTSQAVKTEVELPRNPELDLVVYEDLIHLSELWASETLSNKDIRLSSQIVRRLLLQGDLARVAAPRKLRLMFSAPDNKPLVRAADNGQIVFFQSGGAHVFGVQFRAIKVTAGARDLFDRRGWNAEAVLELRLDSFLAQSVFYFPALFDQETGQLVSIEKEHGMHQAPTGKAEGTFISRRDVINYVANKAGGPHFDDDRPAVNACLDRIRSTITFSLAEDRSVQFGFNLAAFDAPIGNFVPSPKSIDSVFIELAATYRYLSISPVIEQLKEQLRIDLGR
jgi:hypothetical protein